MYGVSHAISSLQEQQMVQAVVIADMVHVDAAAEQAMAALTAAAESEQGLSAAALESLAGLPAWPARLLQLLPVVVQHAPCCQGGLADLAAISAADTGNRVQRLLLAVLGDLEAVWADKQLRKLLLGLPLPAMQLLLSADQLRVAAEDTVLYTASRYKSTHRYPASVIRAALAPTVRAPHLSVFALSCYTVPPISSRMLLGQYGAQLPSLLCLKHIARPGEFANTLAVISDAPASWQLGRQLRPLADGVRLQWQLPVQQLKAACRASFAQQETVDVPSPEASPPMGGRSWGMLVQCSPAEGGTELTLFVGPDHVPDFVFVKSYVHTTTCCGKAYTSRIACAGGQRSPYNCYADVPTCFPEEPMTGGWDEAAWAAAGLPASGDLELQLHMHSVE
jgi:hypothetical protein